MIRSNSKINKIGVLEEPANPNSAKIFFKSAHDWSKLSGYVGNFSSSSSTNLTKPDPYQTQSSDFPIFPKKTIELSHKSHEDKVKTALSYLFLRDLGCSRDDAFSLTSRTRPDNGELFNSLPSPLRKNFRAKLSKSRCLPCRPIQTHDNFESATDAFKQLISKRQLYFDNACAEQEKYLKKVEKDSKKLKLGFTHPCPSPVSLAFESSNGKIRKKDLEKVVERNSTRVVVPEVRVKDDERFRRDIKEWNEELEKVKKGENLLTGKIRIESVEKEKEKEKEKEIKQEVNESKDIQIGRIQVDEMDWLDCKYVNFNEDQNHSKSNFLIPQSSTPHLKLTKKSYLTETPSSPQSLHKPLHKPPTSTSPSLTRSSEARPLGHLSPIESNYFTLLSQEKKLVDQLLLQQFQAAKAKGSESKAQQLQVQTRKKLLNQQISKAKQLNFQKTQEKMQKAQLKKHLKLSRARSK